MKTVALASIASAFLLHPAFAEDEIERWYDSAQKLSWGYTVADGEATISTPGFWDSNARNACKGDITVPARIGPDGPAGAKTYPVRNMSAGLFRNCGNVTSVKLPDGIRRIAPNAFTIDIAGLKSSLTNVTIGAGCLDICSNAFSQCQKLMCVNIPGTVTNIAKDAFSMCYALKRIDIPGSVRTVGDSAFATCNALEEVSLGDGLETICDDAFMRCGMLQAVDLPASVKSIGQRAFYMCDELGTACLREGLTDIGFCAFNDCTSLTNVSIPHSVVHVGERAFENCPDSIFDMETVEGVRLLSGWAVGVKEPSGGIDLFGVNGVADGLFKGELRVTSVALPPGIETLGESMFMGCAALESVCLPAALKSIGDYAFMSCEKITSITIPSGVTNIGEYAFAYCKKLKGVELPANLSQMGDSAFDGCEAITSLDVLASLKSIPMAAFQNCKALEEVTVREGVETIGNASFWGCTALNSFWIPESVKTVGEIAFGECRFLDTNTIENVEIVDGWVVGSSQTRLRDLRVPGDVRGIADNAFDNRRQLTNAVFEAGVKRIPAYAFNCAIGLASVTIPDTVTDIGSFAFCACTSLSSVLVPSNVVSLGEKVFASCSALETVLVPVALKGTFSERDLIDGSFNATIRYYRPDGSLEPLPGPEPDPDPDPDPEVEMRMVTFNPNGGEFGDDEDSVREVEKGAAVGALPAPVRTGYKFGGWWTAKTKGTKVSASTKVTKDVTFYARWSVCSYKVIATPNLKAGGTVSGAGTKAFKAKVTLKAVPKKGYVFVRWELVGDEDTPWPSTAKFRQPSVAFTMGAQGVSVKAVFVKKAADAAPVLSVEPDGIWYVEGEPDRAISVTADSLSYPTVTVKGQPAGIGLVRAADDNAYQLKVIDASKMKPGVYTAKITAKNRAGKSVAKSVMIVAPNSATAIDAGLVSGLETSTLSPYAVDGGMKTKWTLADLGVEVFPTNGWKLVSVKGLPTGLSWNGTAIVGTASKAGIYTVTLTMQKKVKISKKTHTYNSTASATFVVESLLPSSAYGLFNGFMNASVASTDGDDDGDGYATPALDGGASAVTVRVTDAGGISAKFGGVSLAGTGFDSESNGVYSVTLRKTQKITKGALKGGSKVWEAHLEVDSDSAWDGRQLSGTYSAYTISKGGTSSTPPPQYVACQKNAFGEVGAAKAVAGAVAGAWQFTPKQAAGEGWAYDLALGGKALKVSVKANGTATISGTVGKTKVSGSATLEVSAAEVGEGPEKPVHRAAALRFFIKGLVIEIEYSLEGDEVVSVDGRVWR